MQTLKSRALSTTILTAAAMTLTAAANAQVDVVTVTATKVESDAQTIPVAVSALSAGDLDELRVDNFTDYLIQLPGITAGGSGPGQNTLYIRGLASTTPNLTVAGVAGLSPNVAFYLDEQPLAQPGRNLDVYAVDLERIEVLPGPQGTLFGASSQAGTVRLITNKPVLGEFQAYSNFGVSFTQDGAMSNKVEGVVTCPSAIISPCASSPMPTIRAAISTMWREPATHRNRRASGPPEPCAPMACRSRPSARASSPPPICRA